MIRKIIENIITPQNISEEKREYLRSRVRRWVTYLAAFYVFGGGLALIGIVLCKDKELLAHAKEIYHLILPIATGIITYWFASRKPTENKEASAGNGDKGSGENGPENPDTPDDSAETG